MYPKNAGRVFKAFLKSKNLNSKSMTPKQGVDAMLEFFQTERADGCDAKHNDMLLFQWGTYDWGKGENFELDITRQLILEDDAEDDDIWQLHMKFRFMPTKELERLDSGYQWCESMEDIQVFREFINNSAQLQAVANRTDGKIEIYFECAG